MKHWLVIVSFSALVPAGLCSGQDAEVPQAIADAERAEQLRLMHEELSAQLRAIEGEIAKVQNTTEALKSQLEELALQQEGPWGDDRAALEVRAKLVLKVAQVQESLAAELARSRALKEIANALREKVAELREHPQFVEPAAPEPPAGQKPGRLQDKLVELPRDQVVALLDDESFNVRQAAEARLLADDTLDPAALKKLIAQAKSAEQRYRLLRVAEHHVLREVRLREFGDQPQRAAIGFSYQPVLPADNPELTAPAVTVTATMPGFPGHAYLRPGDMVLAINGNAPRGIQHRDLVTTWLSDNIRFHRPGDTVTLTVRRDGTTFDLDVPCGHGNALDQMYTTNGKDAAFRERPYEETWQAARAKLVEGLPEPESLTPAQ